MCPQFGERDQEGGVFAFQSLERIVEGCRVHRPGRMRHTMRLAAPLRRSRAYRSEAVQTAFARTGTLISLTSMPCVRHRLNSLERPRRAARTQSLWYYVYLFVSTDALPASNFNALLGYAQLLPVGFEPLANCHAADIHRQASRSSSTRLPDSFWNSFWHILALATTKQTKQTGRPIQRARCLRAELTHLIQGFILLGILGARAAGTGAGHMRPS